MEEQKRMWLTFGSPKDEAKAFIVFLLKEHCLLLNDVVTEATLESRGGGRRKRGRMDGDEGKRGREAELGRRQVSRHGRTSLAVMQIRQQHQKKKNLLPECGKQL